MPSPDAMGTAPWRARHGLLAVLLAAAAAPWLLWMLLFSTETYDERVHVNVGVVVWRQRNLSWDIVHPPGRAILAIPALLKRMPTPADPIDPLPGYGGEWTLRSARCVTLALFLLWSLLFARIVGHWFTPATGLLAQALILFSPTLTPHAVLATNDVLVTMVCFLLSAAALEWSRRESGRLALAVGLLGGIALLTKYTGLLWLGGMTVGMALWLGRRLAPPRARGAASRGAVAAQVLLMLGLAIVLPALVYDFDGLGQPLASFHVRHGLLQLVGKLLGWLPAPLPWPYWHGMDELLMSIQYRHTYFHGQWRHAAGFRPYFAMLLLAKPPLALHGMLLLALVAVVRQRAGPSLRAACFLVLPPLALLLYGTFGSGIQIGIRHMLPLFPLLFAAAAWGVLAFSRRAWRAVGLTLVLWFILLDLSLCPHQLGYFNPIVGGPAKAWRWFIDSNQDWGQGGRAAKRFIDEFGQEIDTDPVAGKTTGWVLVATNQLVGITPEQGEKFRWLRENFEPVDFIMPCFHLFHIPEDAWRNQTGDHRPRD